jgi:hypothetical protein
MQYNVVAKLTYDCQGLLAHMQLTPRGALLQFAHLFQQEIFPRISAELGPLSPQLELLCSVLGLIPLEAALHARRSRTGRPAKDRAALATAFLAKSILNLPTTRQLIDRLRCDDGLRRLCGWSQAEHLPHESKFSRAFEEFADTELPQQLHAAVIATTQGQRLIGHIARDATAIAARERFPAPPPAKPVRKKGSKKGSKNGSKHQWRRAKAADRGTRIQRQRHMSLPAMLGELSTQCSIGVKTSSQGHQHHWRGYKLHLDVADGQIPISAILTGASVHDSQVAIPLMTLTHQRVQSLYDLMDSAYDAESIHQHSRSLGHVPLIAPNGRNGTRKPSNLPKIFPPKPGRQFTWAEYDRFRERTMVERVYARLKDEFGASQIRVRGANKVMAHLSFGILALTVDQWLKLAV